MTEAPRREATELLAIKLYQASGKGVTPLEWDTASIEVRDYYRSHARVFMHDVIGPCIRAAVAVSDRQASA